jgi:hypothetical protein
MVYAVVDGSSLTLADPQGRKDFGQVGSHQKGARGLKVITAYTASMTGVPLGVLWQTYWARLKRARRERKSTDNRWRKVSAKETQRWLDVIQEAASRTDPRKLWFLVDREGDSRTVLRSLARSALASRCARRLRNEEAKLLDLRAQLARVAPAPKRPKVSVAQVIAALGGLESLAAKRPERARAALGAVVESIVLTPQADGRVRATLRLKNETAALASGRAETRSCGGALDPTPQKVLLLRLASDLSPVRGISTAGRLLRRVEEPTLAFA